MGYSDKEKAAEYARKWRAKHAEQVRQEDKERREAWTPEQKEQRAEYNRNYQRERHRRLYATDPVYKAQCDAKLKARREAGYFREYQRKQREEAGEEGRKREAQVAREWRAANRERARAIDKKCKAKQKTLHPDRWRNKWLKMKYGMTLAEYQDRLTQQGNCCAICGCSPSEGKSLVVDHDHSKPKGEGNRGLLCQNCNALLGMAAENPERLRRAADYLER